MKNNEKETRLHSVACANSDMIWGDIIFIHGLGGHHVDTWQPKGKTDLYWPIWVAKDFPTCNVWSLQYPSTATQWTSIGANMGLLDRAKEIINYLVSLGIGTRPTIYIVHSLGGLLTKQILRASAEMNYSDWAKIIPNTKGVVFIASPHSVSNLANFAGLAKTLSLASNLVEDLKARSPLLRDLRAWYRQNAEKYGIKTLAFHESRNTFGVRIVNEDSADPGVKDCKLIPTDADHLSICRPISRNNPLYLGVKSFIENIQKDFLGHNNNKPLPENLNNTHTSEEQVNTGGGTIQGRGDEKRKEEYFHIQIDIFIKFCNDLGKLSNVAKKDIDKYKYFKLDLTTYIIELKQFIAAHSSDLMSSPTFSYFEKLEQENANIELLLTQKYIAFMTSSDDISDENWVSSIERLVGTFRMLQRSLVFS